MELDTIVFGIGVGAVWREIVEIVRAVVVKFLGEVSK